MKFNMYVHTMYSKIYLQIWGSIFNTGNFKFLHCQRCDVLYSLIGWSIEC